MLFDFRLLAEIMIGAAFAYHSTVVSYDYSTQFKSKIILESLKIAILFYMLAFST